MLKHSQPSLHCTNEETKIQRRGIFFVSQSFFFNNKNQDENDLKGERERERDSNMN